MRRVRKCTLCFLARLATLRHNCRTPASMHSPGRSGKRTGFHAGTTCNPPMTWRFWPLWSRSHSKRRKRCGFIWTQTPYNSGRIRRSSLRRNGYGLFRIRAIPRGPARRRVRTCLSIVSGAYAGGLTGSGSPSDSTQDSISVSATSHALLTSATGRSERNLQRFERSRRPVHRSQRNVIASLKRVFAERSAGATGNVDTSARESIQNNRSRIEGAGRVLRVLTGVRLK